ncbi:MAG: thioesterase [Bacteroidetes bacterium]|jgi:acyl-CoA thioester hydrolase|nr:thioesterase [Bacteroidota bacterium]
MLTKETRLRVRYGETDRMGYVYYGNYAEYYEVGRVEALRELGFSYKEMEDKGIMLPVLEFTISYKKPAFYDDEIRIVTSIRELPGVRITFHYECYNQANELLNSGRVTLVFIDKSNNRPCQPPDWFKEAISPFFTEVE